MKKSSLLGTALLALLVASPGFAFAQNGGNGVANGNPAYTAAPGNANDVRSANGTNGYNGTNGANGTEFRPYGQIGFGGYNGAPLPINNGNGNNNGNNNANNQRPSQRNPLLADNGDVRAGKMIGTAIYNDSNKKLGSVSDVLIGRNGAWVIVAANNHKVAVPFRNFVFGDSNVKGNDKLVLPNLTEAQLNSMPVFHYNAKNYANNNGGSGLFGGNNRNNGNGNNKG
jgi:hypothetical protein